MRKIIKCSQYQKINSFSETPLFLQHFTIDLSIKLHSSLYRNHQYASDLKVCKFFTYLLKVKLCKGRSMRLLQLKKTTVSLSIYFIYLFAFGLLLTDHTGATIVINSFWFSYYDATKLSEIDFVSRAFIKRCATKIVACYARLCCQKWGFLT